MTTVSETIPESLQPEVAAALDWFNGTQEISFDVTGIVDPDASFDKGEPRELRLVLCGGDRCEQHSFRVAAGSGGFQVSLLEAAPAAADPVAGPAELDPPPGAMRGWIDRTLPKHAFVVLVFYRGFW